MSVYAIQSTETYLPDEEGSILEGRLRSAYRCLDGEDFETAELHFREALALDPENVGALLSLALCLAQGPRRFLSAEKLARRAMHLDPENPECYFALGRINLVGARRERARRYFQQALRLAPAEERFKKAYRDLNPPRSKGLTHFFHRLAGRGA
jgi:tetratricopeptide (TPR) repeat protein